MIAQHLRTAALFLLAAAILACGCLLQGAEFAGNLHVTAVSTAPAPASAQNATDHATRTPLTREHVLSTLARDIAAHYRLDGELQLELMRPWNPPARVAGRWDIAVVDFPSVPSSSLMLRCRFLADGSNAGEQVLMLRAQLWRDAWTTRQPLTVGASFDPAMLEARRVDLLRERDALPAAVGDQTYIFARAVPAGRQLTWRDIARRPLVKKGDLVDVAAIEGLLVVTMKALAMENGARGDTVTVRNPESRKDFAAMVIDENRVQVRF